MKIIDESLLAEIRRLPCAWCGRPGPSEAAHLMTKGLGGWARMDVRINLAPLCRDCHQASHDGNPPIFGDLLALVASREETTQDAILVELYRLRRITRGDDGQGPAGPGDDHDGRAGQDPDDQLPPAVPAQPPVDRAAGVEADEGDGGWLRF